MNIYVGNLSFKMSDSDLESIFEEFGTVNSVNIITDKFTGKSKGFGFVTMDDPDEAQRAIKELNGATFENRKLIVNEARPRKNFD